MGQRSGLLSVFASLQFRVNTFGRNLQLAAFGNLHSLLWLVTRVLVRVLDLVDDLIALKNFAKDNMASVEPRGNCRGDEKLAAIGVFAGVGHAQKTSLAVLELEVLVGELGPVDGLSAGAWFR
jgi:hypothetical protein